MFFRKAKRIKELEDQVECLEARIRGMQRKLYSEQKIIRNVQSRISVCKEILEYEPEENIAEMLAKDIAMELLKSHVRGENILVIQKEYDPKRMVYEFNAQIQVVVQ